MEENQAITANKLAKRFFSMLYICLQRHGIKCPKISQKIVKCGGFFKEGVIVEEYLEETFLPQYMMKDEDGN